MYKYSNKTANPSPYIKKSFQWELIYNFTLEFKTSLCETPRTATLGHMQAHYF